MSLTSFKALSLYVGLRGKYVVVAKYFLDFCLRRNTPFRHSRIGHTYKKGILFVVVRHMFVLCSLNVLFMSCCHPSKSVTDGQRSLSSPESFEHPPNLELHLKRSEMECA